MSTSFSGTLDKAQLEELWVDAGGSASAENTAAAIALAESGGQQDATDHDANGTTDEGYWQINTVHGALATYDPLGNAKAAVAISDDGSNWTPWVTYTSGAYEAYLGEGASNETTSTTATTTATEAASSNPLIPAGRGSGNALKWLAYAILFITGGALIYLGVKRSTHGAPS